MSHSNTSDSCRRFDSVLIVMVIGLCAATPAQAQTDPAECERLFLGQRIITTLADGANSVFAADLDGDGDNDVLSASLGNDPNDASGGVAWYENTDGLGTFGPQRVIATAAEPAWSVFATDLDGDGDVDVLSTFGYGNEIAWYENTDGLGTFGPQQVIATDLAIPRTVFAADLDGDGDIDVVSASGDDWSAYGPKIAWYENTDGRGTFGPQQVLYSSRRAEMSVFVADVDGDGDNDILSSASDDKIAWYENTDGLGTFGLRQVISADVDGAISVFAADLDGDGDIDVLSASRYDDKIAWYENTDGLGAFGTKLVITNLADRAQSVFATDLDGDGDNDVLSASSGSVPDFISTVAWYENADGLGTFGPQRIITIGTDGARSVFAADLDGDGDPDVLSASSEYRPSGISKVAWYEHESDCNGNGVNDGCDVADGTSADCTDNDIPDECEGDCNENGTADSCDILDQSSSDCDENGVPDECDPDCNRDSIPDACESDCNDNGVADACDLLAGTLQDADGDGVPDECAFFRMVPVDPPAIVDPYPAGVEIVGNEIFVPAGGQRIWLEIKLGGWAPELLKTWQARINSAGYFNGVGARLAPPLVPCVSDAFCEFAIGSPTCLWDGMCQAAYQNDFRPDFVVQDGLSAVSTYGTPDFIYGSTAFMGSPVVDEGKTYYGGTLVLDVPRDAAGRYVVGFHHIWGDTWRMDETSTTFPVGSAPARITVCATDDQPPCCLPSGACLLLDPDCCVAMGGESSSTAIDCTGDLDSNGIPDACDTPDVSTEIPTISTWGLAAIALLLLCGAKIAFGIRRTRRLPNLQ